MWFFWTSWCKLKKCAGFSSLLHDANCRMCGFLLHNANCRMCSFLLLHNANCRMCSFLLLHNANSRMCSFLLHDAKLLNVQFSPPWFQLLNVWFSHPLCNSKNVWSSSSWCDCRIIMCLFSVFMMQIAESAGFLLHDAIFSLLIWFAAPAQASSVCLLLLDKSKYFRSLEEEEEDELGKGNIGFCPSFFLQVWMAQVLDFFYTMNHWLGQTLSLFTLFLNSFFFPKSRV